MKHSVLFVFMSMVLFLACKKENKDNQDEIPGPDYTPLLIGSYWVYDHYEIDTLGNETKLSYSDSVRVDRDTLIRGNTYYVLTGTNHPVHSQYGIVSILRDSSDYLVNHLGSILFSSENFTDILYQTNSIVDQDTLYTSSYKMEKPVNPVVVPAGTFDVLNYKGTIHITHPVNGIVNPRYIHTMFAPSVGKVLETYIFLSSPMVFEKRLNRYFINNILYPTAG